MARCCAYKEILPTTGSALPWKSLVTIFPARDRILLRNRLLERIELSQKARIPWNLQRIEPAMSVWFHIMTGFFCRAAVSQPIQISSARCSRLRVLSSRCGCQSPGWILLQSWHSHNLSDRSQSRLRHTAQGQSTGCWSSAGRICVLYLHRRSKDRYRTPAHHAAGTAQSPSAKVIPANRQYLSCKRRPVPGLWLRSESSSFC